MTSPLALAAIAGDLDRARFLLLRGADVNQPDQYGWLPLHRAAANNRAPLIRYLLAQGSHIEARGTDQWTPLHLACVSGSSRSVAALVRGGADVNSVARGDSTPLHLAMIPVIDSKYPDLHREAVRQVRRTVQILLRAGAKPRLDANGQTPADVARERGAEELAQLLESTTP
jgi:ankyrin repeat protein